jgi:adenylate cyclase
MRHVQDAFAIIEKGGETWVEAEIHRLKGDLLGHQGNFRDAALSYQRAYSLACQHEAHSFALRAALSLSKIWVRQARHTQAQKLLQDVRAKFDGQADSQDLNELNSLLEGAARHTGSHE